MIIYWSYFSWHATWFLLRFIELYTVYLWLFVHRMPVVSGVLFVEYWEIKNGICAMHAWFFWYLLSSSLATLWSRLSWTDNKITNVPVILSTSDSDHTGVKSTINDLLSPYMWFLFSPDDQHWCNGTRDEIVTEVVSCNEFLPRIAAKWQVDFATLGMADMPENDKESIMMEWILGHSAELCPFLK